MWPAGICPLRNSGFIFVGLNSLKLTSCSRSLSPPVATSHYSLGEKEDLFVNRGRGRGGKKTHEFILEEKGGEKQEEKK